MKLPQLVPVSISMQGIFILCSHALCGLLFCFLALLFFNKKWSTLAVIKSWDRIAVVVLRLRQVILRNLHWHGNIPSMLKL